MERYSYVAVDSHKKRIRGQILAQDEKQLSDLLFNLDLYLVSYKKLKTTTPNSFFTLSGSIKIKDIAVFCKQFGTMINSGVSIVETLESLSVQPAYPQMMRLTLQQVLGDVTSGLLLSEAMSKHKKIFPEFFLSMISVGEASGKLDTVFLNMGDYYDNQVRIKSKMISAISYPVFLLVMTIGVVAIISFVVVPQFQKVFAELGQELPQITQMVFDFAEFVKNNWMVIVLVVFGVIITIIALKRTKKGKYFFDKLAANFFLSKGVISAGFAARFARCFSLLLSSGMQAVPAMETLSTLLGNAFYTDRFVQSITDVKNGVTLTKAFRKTGVFPPMLLQMVAIGERTAQIEEMLTKTSSIFEQQQSEAIDRMTASLQPILLMIIAVFVLVVLLAIFLPLMDMTKNLG